MSIVRSNLFRYGVLLVLAVLLRWFGTESVPIATAATPVATVASTAMPSPTKLILIPTDTPTVDRRPVLTATATMPSIVVVMSTATQSPTAAKKVVLVPTDTPMPTATEGPKVYHEPWLVWKEQNKGKFCPNNTADQLRPAYGEVDGFYRVSMKGDIFLASGRVEEYSELGKTQPFSEAALCANPVESSREANTWDLVCLMHGGTRRICIVLKPENGYDTVCLNFLEAAAQLAK